MSDEMQLIDKLENILKLLSNKSEPEFISLRKSIRKHIDVELNIKSIKIELKDLRNMDPRMMNELERGRTQESIEHLEAYINRLEEESRLKLETLTLQLGRVIL